MDYFKWLIAGFVGAAVGGAIWVAVGYYGEMEVGWIAWGIGLLAGIGVRVAAGESDGVGPGVAALVAAIAVVVISKYLVVSFAINAALAGAFQDAGPPTRDDQITWVADQVVEEYEADEKEIAWPEDESVYDDDDLANDYPSEVWEEAARRWDALSKAEQEAQAAEQKAMQEEFMNLLIPEIKQQAFQESFAPWDLLWLGLAAWTAFKVGSGASDE